MPKNQAQVDVLVLGEHPAAYLAAALCRHKTKLRIVHSCIPQEHFPDRLVTINPNFFSLHPLLESLKRKIELKGVYGLEFHADDPATRAEYRTKSASLCIASLRDVRSAMERLAADQEVEFIKPKVLQVHGADEHGVDVTVGKDRLHPRCLILAGRLAPEQEKILGLPEDWEPGVIRRYSYVRLKGNKWADSGSRPLMPMSLDLKGMLIWAWLLAGDKVTQLAVEQPVSSIARAGPHELLTHWANVLHTHQVLKSLPSFSSEEVESLDLPLAGALAHEGVANRTLLIGPAGGFYSACSEDVYPNCWSAIFAADVAKQALKQPHLQDALQPFRQKWRTTLGDYLRGPQQNLKFLLPLVYRNPVMTSRLAEAILTGKSVVR